MNALYHTVSVGMVGGRGDVIASKKLISCSPKFCGELATAISFDGKWHTKARYPRTIKARAAEVAVMSMMGIPSGQRVKRSMQVNR